MSRNKNEKAMEDAVIKLVANAYVEKEGKKIREEAKNLNQVEDVSDEKVAKFEDFCSKEFTKLEWKSRLMNISKVAVAVVAIFVFILGTYQFSLTNNLIVNENQKGTTIADNGKDYLGDEKFVLTYIPKGFFKKNIEYTKMDIVKVYYSSEGRRNLTLCYKLVSDINMNKNNNENFKIVDINGVEAKVTSKPDGEIVEVTWEKDSHIFCIEAKGVDEEEVIKVAKSVKSVK